MTQIQKIRLSSLKTILTTLPISKAHVRYVNDWLTGYDWPVKEDLIILIPEEITISRDLPARRQGYYSVTDIIEIPAGEEPQDNIRLILFEGAPERMEDLGPPMRLFIESVNPGPEAVRLEMIPGDHETHMDLLEGIANRIRELTGFIQANLDLARDNAAQQLRLQQML